MELLTENDIFQNKRNRFRGENWTQEEKDLLLKIMRKSAPIVEIKLTDTNTNRRKKLEWLNIQKKLKALTGKPRDIAQLKGFWRRYKIAAKKSVSQHRTLQATAGGKRPSSPSPEDLKVLECCRTAVPDEPPVNDGSNTIGRHNSSTLYDIDEDFDIKEGSETTVIADVHSKEIDRASVDIQHKESVKKTKVFSDAKTDKSQARRNITRKAAVLESNIEIRKRASEMMEKEHELKMKYHIRELAHQRLRHELEEDLYLLDKEKKQLEIQILKKELNKE